MRRSLPLAIFLAGLAAAAQAAPGHSGSWHSVEARSSWSNGQLPKGFSLTIDLKFDGETLAYSSLNDTDKAKPGGMKYTATVDGKPAPIANNARFNQVVVKREDANHYEVLEMKDDDVIVGSFWTFSEDGKTFVRRGVGKGADGKSKAFTEVFQRK